MAIAEIDGTQVPTNDNRLVARASELFWEQRLRLDASTDRLFAALFIVQWIAEIAVALWISPLTWAGTQSQIHPHVWTAVFLGGAVVVLPLLLILKRPGQTITRLAIGVAQALSTAIVIHLTGGRLETHFFVFVSLALLAFYRDWRVLVAASAVVACDHLVRGVVWPQSVYGVNIVNPWRFLEHAGWVVMEDIFLFVLCRQGLLESWNVAERQAELEATNETVLASNTQLREEIVERQRTQLALERAKNAAEAASRAKTEFLANMSHELRTPLNAVIGFSDVLSEQAFGPLNEDQAQYVTDILESGQHLLSLVNDILDLAKIENGSMEIQRGSIMVPRLVERAVQMFRERAVRQGLRLVADVDSNMRMIVGDERRLKQLLYNLLSNAIKFTPEGGEVRVTVRPEVNSVVLTVADTGIGIPLIEQQKVFESFYQMDSTLSKNAQGTGLGLAMVRQIVELHGGTVCVASEPGQGSSFIVTLPQSTGAEHEAQTAIVGEMAKI